MARQEYRFERYKAKDGHRWRVKHKNGNIIADGGEAYVKASDRNDAMNHFIARIVNGSYDFADDVPKGRKAKNEKIDLP